MDVVEDFVTTTKSTTTSNAHWLNCFYAAVGIAGYICLLHSKGLLDHVKP